MLQLIQIIIILPLVIFYFWMFWHMANNKDLPDNPSAPLTWPPITRYHWALAFVFLNIFAAIAYFVYVYKNK